MGILIAKLNNAYSLSSFWNIEVRTLSVVVENHNTHFKNLPGTNIWPTNWNASWAAWNSHRNACVHFFLRVHDSSLLWMRALADSGASFNSCVPTALLGDLNLVPCSLLWGLRTCGEWASREGLSLSISALYFSKINKQINKYPWGIALWCSGLSCRLQEWHPTWVPVQVSDAPLTNLLPTDVPRKAVKRGSNAWPLHHVENSDEAPGSLFPGLTLAITVLWRVNQ